MEERNKIQHYKCQRVSKAPPLEGKLEGEWEKVEFTNRFIDIRGIREGVEEPRFETRVKMVYDDEQLYIGAKLMESDVWNTIKKKNETLYWENDFEIFIDPDGDGLNYYEFEMNALNTIWELTLDKPYNKGGNIYIYLFIVIFFFIEFNKKKKKKKGHATHPTNIDGLISNVYIDGTINDASDVDNYWSLTVGIPWKGLKRYVNKENFNSPPNLNEVWRINFSRVEWRHVINEKGDYERVPKENPGWDEHPEDNWVWSQQGEVNMHKPECWGCVEFV
ncbi:hypothetical protein HDU92_007286 [Lobulomyces angularis]|nr:hypothetical protein HDU92_007286 [Lobulomyces angularis]